MKKYLIVAALAVAAAWPIAQTVSIAVHPQAGGVTCYTTGAALSCVHIPGTSAPATPGASATLTTGTLVPTTQAPTFTAIPIQTATKTSTSVPTLTRPPLPTFTPAPALLINGDFESTWSTGWTRFDRFPDLPQFNDERGHPESRHGGAQSLRIFNEYRCHLSGVYQRVNVTQFQTYVFSAWVRTYGSNSSIFPGPSDTSITDAGEVGIDPNGGTDPGATSVIWGRNESTEQWRKVSVQAVAFSNRITVFIQARLGVSGGSACQWPIPFLIGFIDDAALTVAD